MSRSFSSLGLFALLLSACDEGQAGRLPAELGSERSGGNLFDAVCSERYVVARGSSCENLPEDGWLAEPTFGAAAPGVLSQYCTYRGSASSDITTLQSTFPGVEFSADCQAVSAQGEAIQDLVGGTLDDEFAFLTGRLAPGQLSASYGSVSQSPVEVTVVDTYPDAEPAEPYSDHGPMVMSIVESTACGGGTCAVSVGAELGLPRVGSVADTVRGGYNGRQSDLANGVFAAVQGSTSDRLIINLSVGWESDVFGGTGPADMPPPVRAVYDALRYARCRGALIIVSAGNSTSMTSPEVPLAPARWEGIPAPAGNECSADFGLPAWSDGASYAPLVHSVGGLLGRESAMSTTREFGMPRLAAAASHAVAQPRQGLSGAVVRTGTSVSAAVASGAAAAIWSLDPSQSPSEVMQRLYISGTATGGTSDFGGAALPVHRIDVCEAVKSVLGPGSPQMECETSSPYSVSALASHVLSAAEPLQNPAFGVSEDCDGTTFYPAVGEVRDCSLAVRDPWDALTNPQPFRSGCSDCVLKTAGSESTALLTIHEEWDGEVLETVDVEVHEESGDIHRFSITEAASGAVAELRSDEISHYELPIDLSGAKPTRALVYMNFASGLTTEDVMLVD